MAPRPSSSANKSPGVSSEGKGGAPRDLKREEVERAAALEYARAVRGPFADVLPARALARGRYSMRDQLVDLRQIPQHPRKVFNFRHLLALAKRLFDLFGNRQTRFGRVWTRVNPYPHPFRRVAIRSFDGTRIAGWLALQPSRRPGVVLVPGLFSSKDDTAQRKKALKIWRRWNYNVLTIDMRGFGQSQLEPSTPGWKEAEDVLAAVRFLSSFNPVSKVAVVGESMGATAALLAAAQEGVWEEERLKTEGGPSGQMEPGDLPGEKGRQEESRIEKEMPAAREAPTDGPQERGEVGTQFVPGGRPQGYSSAGKRLISAVFAVSPFAEARPAVAHLDRVPPRSVFFQHSVHRIFRRLLQATTDGRHTSFLAYMEDAAAHYGVSVEELYARSDLTRVISHIRCPSLILHAEDDDLVPLAHADRLSRLVENREDVAVWILGWGRHVEFDILDHRWYWRVKSRFFGQWVGR
jgi:pimeloyl-ACP methyl ester carboxylesterase